MQRKLAPALCVTLSLLTATPAPAEVLTSEAAPSRMIFVPRDKSMAFRLDRPATRIVVAQPETAKIVATTDRTFYVQGLDLGSTNLLVYGPGGRLQEVIDVRVGYDAGSLQEDLAAAVPGEQVRVTNLGEGLLLSGNITNSGAANRIRLIAEKFAPEAITYGYTVSASQQVVLEVRVLEASRTALQEAGVNITAGNNSWGLNTGSGLLGGTAPAGLLTLSGGIGGTNLDVELRALEEKGLIRTLARPNLVALSGEKASFLAGGEFPFPVPSGLNNVTVEFRPFGVKLNFQPVVQDNGLIRLAVEPEVSQIDTSNTVRVGALSVPGLTVRRASTVVELKEGNSFAIAGLFQRDYANSIRQIPGIGDIPVLSALFRSSRWRRAETELVIIVTPRLATAADLANNTQMLTGKEAPMRDLVLTGRSLDRPLTPNPAPPPAAETTGAAKSSGLPSWLTEPFRRRTR